MRIDSRDLIHRKRKKEDEAEWFYEDLQDLLELTPPKDVLFIIGNWNAKVGPSLGNKKMYLRLSSDQWKLWYFYLSLESPYSEACLF